MVNWFFKLFNTKPIQMENTQTNEKPEYAYFNKLSDNCYEPNQIVATRGSSSDDAVVEEMELQKILRNGGEIRYGTIVDMKGDPDNMKHRYK